MSLTPVRPLKRAAETPTAEQQRRPAFQTTPSRTPGTPGRGPRSRYRDQTPTLNTPRALLARSQLGGARHRDVGTSALRREYSVDRSVGSVQHDYYDYQEEEELRDFQQDTVLDAFKGLPAGTILARDTFHQAFVQGSVPDEVRHALFDADFANDRYRAVIDSLTGFAAVSTPQEVFAWNYAKKSFASPTCYTFHPETPTPFVVFVPSQVPQTREPGIVLVDSVAPESNGGSGEILLYDNVTLALTGAQPIRGRLGLKEGEAVSNLDRVDATTLLISTKHARVLRQNIASSDGRPFLSLPTPFIKPNNTWLSRSTDVLFTGPGSDQNEGILGLSIGKEDIDTTALSSSSMGSSLGVSIFMGTPRARSRGVEPNVALSGIGMKREIWILGTSNASGWSVTGTDAKFLKELAILPDVVSHAEMAGTSEIRLRDVATLDHGNVAVLLSFSASGRTGKTVGPTSYAIAVVNPSKESGELVEHVVKLSYTAVEDPRPVAKTRLAVPQKANVAFVQLSGAIVTVSLEKESLYQQSTTFKDPVQNPIIGIGFDRQSLPSRAGKSNEGNVRLTAFAPRSGFMGVEVDPIRLFDFQPRSTALARRAQLENKIEQAVFFEGPANPLTFSLAVEKAASLEQALLAVSDLLVTSKSSYLSAKLNENKLEERQKRLENLIQFVRQMGLLDDLSQVVRKQLAADVTALAVGIDLAELLSQEVMRGDWGLENPEDLLRMAIQETVDAHGGATDAGGSINNEAVNAFFDRQIRDIPAMLQSLPDVVNRHLPAHSNGSHDDDNDRSVRWTIQAMRILSAAMQHAVLGTRERNIEVYELDEQLVDVKSSYLMDKKTVATLQHFYFKAVDSISKLSEASRVSLNGDLDGYTPATNLDELQDGLRALVIPLLFALEEQAKVEAILIEGKSDQRDAVQSKDSLIKDSHQTIFPLITFDSGMAYQVAELFERHYTLVQLAVHPDVGSQERIDAYMSGEFGRSELSAELGYRFAQELFKHYLAEKQYYAILSYSSEYRKAVSDFLRRTERHDLAWPQFLEKGNLQDAGETAYKAASAVQAAQSQKILLSIFKLTHAARKAKGERVDDSKVDYCDNQLSLMKTTEMLRLRIRQSGASSDVHRTAQSYMAGRVTRLQEGGFAALEKLCYENVVALLEGRTIDRESLIDLLTAKDVKSAEDRGDFVSAMKVLRDWQQQEPAALRRQTACLRTIWRRLYLVDDWSVLSDPTETEAAKQDWLGRTCLLQVLSWMRGELSSEFIVSHTAANILPSEEDSRRRYAIIDPANQNGLSRDLEEEAAVLSQREGLSEGIIETLTAKAADA